MAVMPDHPNRKINKILSWCKCVMSQVLLLSTWQHIGVLLCAWIFHLCTNLQLICGLWREDN
jgi:hypothetical protein